MKSSLTKATHNGFDLWQPLIKSSDGKYLAILSDDSLDRDGEIVGKQALRSIMNSPGYTAILLNHKNDVLGQIGEWTNKRLEEIDGHTALVAEPKFYTSNPNTKIITGSLDEGAEYGISIGAIPLESEIITRDGKEIVMYTKLELLEASFVAVPSNRHGTALRVAKMFNKDIGGLKMDKEFTKADLDSAMEKKAEEMKADFAKEAELKDAEIVKLKESVEKSTKVNDEAKVESEKVSKQLEDITEKQKEIEAAKADSDVELEKLKKMSLMKGDSSTTEGEESAEAEVQKGFELGGLPIVISE